MNLPRSILALTLLMASAMPAFSRQSSFVYRWEDDNKAIHITNSLDGIPAKYRGDAKRMEMVTIKSLDSTTESGLARVDGSEKIYFDKSQMGVIVSAMVNKKVRRNAIVDTGSERVVITSKFARALGLDIQTLPKGRFRVFGGVVNAPVARLESVRVGSATAKNVSAAIIDFEGRGAVSAIIGMNFLSRFVFEIDHSKGTLTFLPSQ